MTGAPALQFRLLGPLEVTARGQVVELGGPRQRGVLAALLVEANHVVALDRLVDELWDDAPPPQAIASIQAYVSNLRRALEPRRPPRAPAQVLVTHPPGYVLRVAAEDVDALRFEELAASGHRLLAAGNPEAARESLAQALALWRGPPLADLAQLPFVRAEAVRLEELRLGTVEGRIEADLALGHHAAIIGELESLVTRHPYRERLRACLMLALYRSGRQVDALHAYQATRAAFADELGIDPGPELQQLEGDILRHAPALDWRTTAGAAATPSVSAADPPVAHAAGRDRPMLLGRERALHQLHTVLDHVLEGQGAVFLVSGEPGIGKTRLAEEFATQADERGVTVAWGRCVEGGAAPVFWPWTQAFRRLMASEAMRHQHGHDVELTQLLPELAAPDDGAAPLSWRDPVSARARLHDAVTRSLDTLSSERAVLVVLDDLQWADVPSLVLLHFLATQVGDMRLLLLGLHRDVDLPADAPLTQTLGALLRERAVDHAPLRGLTDDEVREFLDRATGRPPPPGVVTTLSRRTAGNPFFLSQLVRLLDSESTSADWAVANHAVPPSVREVIRRRIGRLPTKAVQLLTTAAVIGPEFDLSVLEDVAGVSGDEALDHIEAALVTGLIRESEEGVEAYRFVHDLVRETLATEISRARRAQVHAAIADALERRRSPGSTENAAELATHLWEGARHVPAARVAAALLDSATQQIGRLALEDAHVQLTRAASLVNDMPPGRERAEVELLVQLRLGLLAMAMHGYASAEAGEALHRAHRLLEGATRTGAEVVAALWGLVAFLAGQCDFDEARRVAGELLELGGLTADRATTMTGHQAAGIVAFHTGSLAEAATHLGAAATAADGGTDERSDEEAARSAAPLLQGDPRVLSRASLALVQTLRGHRDQGERLNAEALELARSLDHPFTSVLALSHAARRAAFVEDAPGALEHARSLVAVATTHGYPQYTSASGFLEGWALARTGAGHAGVARMRESLEAFSSIGGRISLHFFLALLADAELAARRPAEALEAAEQGLRFCATYGERFYESELYRLKGESLLRGPRAQHDAAVQCLHAAVAIAREQGAGLLERRAVSTLGAA